MCDPFSAVKLQNCDHIAQFLPVTLLILPVLVNVASPPLRK